MNKTSLAIIVLAIVAGTAMGLYGLVTTQGAAAQFSTNNTSIQSATQTGSATGGNGAAGGISVGGSANGGAGGSASVSQLTGQQAAQSGAFGSSSNTFSLTR